MRYLAVLVIGILLGALVHREVVNWRRPIAVDANGTVTPCLPAPDGSRAGATQRAEEPVSAAPGSQRTSVEPPSASPPAAPTPPADAGPPLAENLLIPVEGKTAADLVDTFTDARSQGRSHDAIDIMATAGTPVLAAADGTVEKLFTSDRGGLTIYEFEPSGRYAYYYAHLQRYADGLAEKQSVKRGQVIGYVGSTGNASADAPHLHFAIFVLGPERRWWEGQAINPYPLLAGK